MTPATARAALPDLFTRPILCAALALLCTLLAILPAAETAPGTAPALPALRSERATASLPQTLTPLASTDIGAAEQGFWPVEDEGSLQTRGAGIRGSFQAGGAVFQTPAGSVGMTLNAVGDARHLEALREVLPSAHANQVRYDYGALSESYSNGPYGLEQGFTLARPLAGPSNLELKLGLSGTLLPRQQGSQILFQTKAAINVLRYSGLSALDASGRELPARMQLSPNGTLLLQIDTRDARYPVRIDPFVQVGEKFVPSSGSEKIGLGSSIALTPDGKTALIGASGGNGGAYIYTRSGTRWTKVEAFQERATSVALSANGNTVLLGSPDGASLYTRSGSHWTARELPAVKKTYETATNEFGYSVALSANGETALIGAPREGNSLFEATEGAAYVFTASGSTWTQQAKLEVKGKEMLEAAELGAHAFFGSSVALSSDGNTALIGAGGFDQYKGAALTFTRSGSTWTQRGGKLTGAGEEGEGAFGDSVALAANGKTALIGAYQEDGHRGSAYVFVRSGSRWTQQGERLKGAGLAGYGAFGKTLALSADGNTALIGAPLNERGHGAAWLFKRSDSTWTQRGSVLRAKGQVGYADVGTAAALAADGMSALIGGSADSAGVGAVWTFEQRRQHVARSTTKITIEEVVVTSSAVLVRVAISTEGVVTVSGKGVTGASKKDGAGVYEFRLPFTKAGQRLDQQSASIKVSAALKTQTQTVSTVKEVKL